MQSFEVNGKKVNFYGFNEASEGLAKDYLTYVDNNKEDKEAVVAELNVKMEKDNTADIRVHYVQDKPRIERIRRITGYSL